MKCPFCTFHDSKVIDSRPADAGSSIRRRRECLSCSKRFTTYETMETSPMIVKKRDGSSQNFDRAKVRNGLIRACEKRPVPVSVLEEIIGSLEASLQNTMERQTTSATIGEILLAELKKVDEVAYVRFASVYRQFENINAFRDELNKLLEETRETGGGE